MAIDRVLAIVGFASYAFASARSPATDGPLPWYHGHMPHDLTLILSVLAPLVVLVALRVNATFVFLGLCLGEVLVRFTASDVNSFMGVFTAHVSAVSNSTMQLGLLLVPAALTAVIMLWSVRGRVKILLNALPAAAASLLGLLLAVPLLPAGARHSIEAQTLWHQLVNAQAAVVGLGALVSLLFLWSQRKRVRVGDEGGHRRR